MKMFVTIMDKFNLLLKILLGVLLAVSLVVLTCQIISRFVLNAPLTWSDELLRYLLVWITFIGAGLAIRYSKLIRLEFLFNIIKFPNNVERGIRGLAVVITIVFCVILLLYSMQILEVVHVQRSAAMHIPMSIPYLAIPLGSLIMLFNSIAAWIEGEEKSEGGEII